MSGYVLSPRARTDLEDIWDYTAERWGVTQAESYLRQLETTLQALAAAPEIAKACDDVLPGYRRHPAGAHVVFFRVALEGIDVVRILHGRMDFSHRL